MQFGNHYTVIMIFKSVYDFTLSDLSFIRNFKNVIDAKKLVQQKVQLQVFTHYVSSIPLYKKMDTLSKFLKWYVKHLTKKNL